MQLVEIIGIILELVPCVLLAPKSKSAETMQLMEIFGIMEIMHCVVPAFLSADLLTAMKNLAVAIWGYAFDTGRKPLSIKAW